MPKKKKPRIPRRYPSQERSKDTVNAILEATAQILERQGNATTSTNAIAEKAGVSIGGLYQYFPNKNSILQALCLREREKDVEALRNCLMENDQLPLEKLTPRILETALIRLLDRPQLRQILEYELPDGKPEESMRALRKELAKLITHRLHSLTKHPLPRDAEFRLFVLISGLESAFYNAIRISGTQLDRKHLIEDASSLILFYLGKMH